MKIVNKYLAVRELLSLTQVQVSAYSSVNRRRIQEIEHGDKPSDLEKILLDNYLNNYERSVNAMIEVARKML